MENTTLYVKIPQVHFFIDKNEFNLPRELKECQSHQIPKNNLNTYSSWSVTLERKESRPGPNLATRERSQTVLTSLALVKATPEKAYLSKTRVTPWFSFALINGLKNRMLLSTGTGFPTYPNVEIPYNDNYSTVIYRLIYKAVDPLSR